MTLEDIEARYAAPDNESPEAKKRRKKNRRAAVNRFNARECVRLAHVEGETKADDDGRDDVVPDALTRNKVVSKPATPAERQRRARENMTEE